MVAPQIAAVMATICTAVCATVSLYIRTKAAGLEKRVADCEKMCKECEAQRAADEIRHKKEVAERDEMLMVEWPSDDFSSKAVAENIVKAASVNGIKVNVAQVSRLIVEVKKRRERIARESETAANEEMK